MDLPMQDMVMQMTVPVQVAIPQQMSLPVQQMGVAGQQTAMLQEVGMPVQQPTWQQPGLHQGGLQSCGELGIREWQCFLDK